MEKNGSISQLIKVADREKLINEINSELPVGAKIFNNQLDTALSALNSFDNNFPRPNHIIIQGKTQAGKTGVLTSMIMSIKILGLAKDLGINKIYYITGDNSRKLTNQTEKRISKCFDGDFDCELTLLKNSDMSKQLKTSRKDEISNCLIFIDESHYGTNDYDNILIKFLEYNGLDMKNSNSLIEKNVYIISASATPYAEIRSDIDLVKRVCLLQVNEWEETTQSGYVGFSQFDRNDCIYPITENISPKTVDKYVNIISEKLNEIEKNSGKRKCVIARINSKSYKKIKNKLKENFEIAEFFSSNNANIPYAEIENLIQNHISDYELPLLIVIAGAYRMGISIPPYCKSNIGVVFDFSNSPEVSTTEQGLLGRMSGYWNNDDWHDLTIMISKNHYDELKNCYVNKKYSTPTKERITEEFIVDEINGKSLFPIFNFGSEKYPEYENNDYSLKLLDVPEEKIKELCDKSSFGNPWSTYLKEQLDKKYSEYIGIPVFFPQRNFDNKKSGFYDVEKWRKNPISKSEHGFENKIKDLENKKICSFLLECRGNNPTLHVKIGLVKRGNWMEKIHVNNKRIIETLNTGTKQ